MSEESWSDQVEREEQEDMMMSEIEFLKSENAELKEKLAKFDRLKLVSFCGYTEDELRTMIQHYKETGYDGLIHENAALKERIKDLQRFRRF